MYVFQTDVLYSIIASNFKSLTWIFKNIKEKLKSSLLHSNKYMNRKSESKITHVISRIINFWYFLLRNESDVSK